MKELSDLSKRQKRLMVFLIILIIALSYLFYTMVMPRSELSVNTTVHYSFSGISVGIQIKNSGTLDIQDVRLNITITDSDEEVEYQEDLDIGFLGKREETTHSFTFSAPQVEPYDMVLRFTYTCDGKEYNETIDHRMQDYMNFAWKDKIRDWRL